ncbi:hypothetical protein BJY01DRAFT_148600 [Aspergillus pseudoustus]|uniref:Uncharacterized protein n=1 Tax=Aspergillus pseudoustus TaxID=1810923 RepID=A0ABR4KA09_9EURO
MESLCRPDFSRTAMWGCRCSLLLPRKHHAAPWPIRSENCSGHMPRSPRPRRLRAQGGGGKQRGKNLNRGSRKSNMQESQKELQRTRGQGDPPASSRQVAVLWPNRHGRGSSFRDPSDLHAAMFAVNSLSLALCVYLLLAPSANPFKPSSAPPPRLNWEEKVNKSRS